MDLPNELLWYILCIVPVEYKHMAFRTCKLWSQILGKQKTYIKAITNSISLIKWAHKEYFIPCDDKLMISAIRKDNTQVMNYLCSGGYPRPKDVCLEAVINGSLKVLKQEVGKSKKLDETFSDITFSDIAAKAGHLKMLKWMYYKRNAFIGNFVLRHAAAGGHFDIVEWLHSENYPSCKFVCADAAGSGNLKLLQWLVDRGYEYDGWMCIYAAEKGNVEILDWIIKNLIPWEEWMCKYLQQDRYLNIKNKYCRSCNFH